MVKEVVKRGGIEQERTEMRGQGLQVFIEDVRVHVGNVEAATQLEVQTEAIAEVLEQLQEDELGEGADEEPQVALESIADVLEESTFAKGGLGRGHGGVLRSRRCSGVTSIARPSARQEDDPLPSVFDMQVAGDQQGVIARDVKQELDRVGGGAGVHSDELARVEGELQEGQD